MKDPGLFPASVAPDSRYTEENLAEVDTDAVIYYLSDCEFCAFHSDDYGFKADWYAAWTRCTAELKKRALQKRAGRRR